MARLSSENLETAYEIIARYPVKKSALIPLLHLAQEQDGWVTDVAMAHIAELVEVTPAEVIGTCTFYEMFKRKPVGKYVVNICTNISCQLLGGEELLHHGEFDSLIDDLKAGTRDEIPAHGTLAKVRQHIPAARRAGAVAPTDRAEPVWLIRNRQEGAS